MIEKKGTMVIIIAIMIILFTELIGINIQIALNYLPILFAIITVILFNLKLKEKITNKKSIIIVNLIVLGIDFILTKLISGIFGYISILAVLILYKFLDEIDFSRFDSFFIKDIVKYYIIPLIILLIIDVGYPKFINTISELSDFWMVDYIYFAMNIIYEILIANIVMVMLVIFYKDIINSKITINISPKRICIISSIIMVIILCIKIVIGCINMSETDTKIEMLNSAIQSKDLNTYYELNLNPNVNFEDMSEIQDKEQKYMVSFNNVLIKGVSSWSELFYKTETNGIQDMVKRKSMTQKEALQKYTESAEKYIERLNIYKENLSLQNVSNIIIYILDIICIFIVYKKACLNE